MPPQEEIDLGTDEGYAKIKIDGVVLTVCPMEEIEKIHNRLGDIRGGQEMLQVIREYIAERTAAQGEGCQRTVSSAMARRFYETLLRAERDIADFFGFPQSSPGSSDLNQAISALTQAAELLNADGPTEKSEPISQTSPESPPESP